MSKRRTLRLSEEGDDMMVAVVEDLRERLGMPRITLADAHEYLYRKYLESRGKIERDASSTPAVHQQASNVTQCQNFGPYKRNTGAEARAIKTENKYPTLSHSKVDDDDDLSSGVDESIESSAPSGRALGVAREVVDAWRDAAGECPHLSQVPSSPGFVAWVARRVEHADREALLAGVVNITRYGSRLVRYLRLATLSDALSVPKGEDRAPITKLERCGLGDYEPKHAEQPTLEAVCWSGETPRGWAQPPQITTQPTPEQVERYVERMRQDAPGEARRWVDRARAVADELIGSGYADEVVRGVLDDWSEAKPWRGLLAPLVREGMAQAYRPQLRLVEVG